MLPPWGTPHLKMKPLPPLQMIPTKKYPKNWTVINTCILLLKEHWKKLAKIPQKCDFLSWSIQNFIKK